MTKSALTVYLFYSPGFGLEEVSEAVKALEKVGIFEVELAGELAVPDSCFNKSRKQFLADCLLKELKNKHPQEKIKIWLVETDLYTHGTNFIFGLAELGGVVACVSSARLKASGSTHLYLKRLRTEVVHEALHLAGFKHCPNPYCVMCFSNSLKDTDRKGEEPCLVCQEKIRLKFFQDD